MLVSPFRSLRVRLIASVVLIEVVMLSLLVWSNMGVITRAYADRLNDTASSLLQQVATTSGGYLVEVDYATLEEYLHNIATQDELDYLVVLDRDRHPVVTLGHLPQERWPSVDTHPSNVGDGVLDIAGDIRIGDRPMGRVLMGFSLDTMHRAIAQARLRSIAIAVTEIVLSILVTVFIGVHLTRRLGKLAGAAQLVGAGNYDVSVETEPPDEVGMTALAFNRMVAEVSTRTRKLEESLARERVIEETAIDGMVTYGSDARIRTFNPAMSTLFGHDAAELRGRPLADLLSGQDDSGLWLRPSGTRVEATGRRRDGSEFPLELYIGHVELEGESLYAATLHDITDRKRAEQECRTLLEGNRFLIHKSLAVQEEERRHLARELHDELGQCLTAIQADAETIRDLSKARDARIETSANAILSVSSRIYDVVHSMMQRLRPGVLDDLGLVAALQEEVDAWRARHPGTDCELHTGAELAGLGEAINITLYRLVQETLTNVAKHARAQRVLVSLVMEENGDGGRRLRLRVEDDGQGLPATPRARGLGLIGMRERVEALGGRLQVESRPGAGTRIEALVPLPAQAIREEES